MIVAPLKMYIVIWIYINVAFYGTEEPYAESQQKILMKLIYFLKQMTKINYRIHFKARFTIRQFLAFS
jgi:hypothetical protein